MVKQMKMDYIIGNPPYIGGLYKKIWLKSIKNIARKGRIQFITPVGFVRQSSEQDYKLRDYIQQYKTKIDLYTNTDIFPIGASACGGGITVTDINFSKESSSILVCNHIGTFSGLKNLNENGNCFQSQLIGEIPLFEIHQKILLAFNKVPRNERFNISELNNPYKEIKHEIPHSEGQRIKTPKYPIRATGYKTHYKKTPDSEFREFYVKDKFFDNYLFNKYTVIQHEMNIAMPLIVPPGEVFSELFYVIGVFNTLKEAEDFKNYIMTTPIQLHLACSVTTIKASKHPYKFIPRKEISFSQAEIFEMEKVLSLLKKNLTSTIFLDS